MHPSHYEAYMPEKTDPDSPCLVELFIHDAEKNDISSGVHGSIAEAMYHILAVLRDAPSAVAPQVDKRASMNGWKPSTAPPYRIALQCVHRNNPVVRRSSRFARARLDRVLPKLAAPDWSGKDVPRFCMQRPRRKDTNGKRYPKRDPFVVLSLADVERRLRTRWFYRKQLVLTIPTGK